MHLEKDDLHLWTPVLLGLGAAFYILFEANFLANFQIFAALFCAAAVFYFLNRTSYRSLVFLACAIFLLGSFYTFTYQKIFLSHTKITGKVYVDAVGKIESIKKFYNPQNGVAGPNLVISRPVMYKAKFVEKKVAKKKKIKKPKKAKSKKPTGPRHEDGVTPSESSTTSDNLSLSPRRTTGSMASAEPEITGEVAANDQVQIANQEPLVVSEEEIVKPKKPRKPRVKKPKEKKEKVKKPKKKKKKQVSQKTIQKNSHKVITVIKLTIPNNITTA